MLKHKGIYAYIQICLLFHLHLVNKIRDRELLDRFGRHLKSLREAKGLSQEKLANLCDVTISQISRIERGQVNTTISTLEVLAKALEISRSELMDF